MNADVMPRIEPIAVGSIPRKRPPRPWADRAESCEIVMIAAILEYTTPADEGATPGRRRETNAGDYTIP